NGCFSGDQTLCQYVIRRDNLPNGVIDRVENLFINLANQKISGIDLEVNYRRSINLFGGGAEGLGWRLYATKLSENSTQNPGAARDERLGQLAGGFSLPEYKFTTNLAYTNGPYSAFLQGRYIGDGKLDRLRTESAVAIAGVATIDDNTVGSVFYTDLTLGYRVESLGDFAVSFNVTNLFDRWPPLAPGVMGRTGTTEFNSALHDVVGRRYALGVNYRF
ncbi:MAG: TonB-dependent receptor, partial [Pseudomonadota bacterium]